MLNPDPRQKHDSEQAETKDDAPVAPRVRSPTPLQSQQQTDHVGHQQSSPQRIHLAQNPDQVGRFRALGLVGALDDEEHHHSRDRAKRQVDPEAPPPSDRICEGAAERGSNDLGDAGYAANYSCIYRTLLQREALRDDYEGAGEDACAADAGDGSADDEGDRIWSGCADD